jgi:hypothetical protein
MAAWGASSLKSYGGNISRSAYGATIPYLPTNSDDMMVIPQAGIRGNSNWEYTVNFDQLTNRTVQFPHMHYIGFDLERCAGALFSGVNTRSSPPYVDVTFGKPMNTTIQSQAWGLSDCVLVIDTTSKTIQAFI